MSLPLSGRTVLVTRPEGQSESLARRLEALGAQVFIAPAIQIAPLEDPAPLDAALQRLGEFDWLVLTSVNGVAAVQERLTALGKDGSFLIDVKVAVIGPATNAALEDLRGKPAELCPEEFVSEAIAEALGIVAGQRFLLARADIARKDLAQILRSRGALVTEVAAYRILPAGPADLPDQCPDYITVTSSSAALATVERLKVEGKESWLRGARLVAIGPIAASSLEQAGHPADVVAEVYTTDGIIDALVRHAGVARV